MIEEGRKEPLRTPEAPKRARDVEYIHTHPIIPQSDFWCVLLVMVCVYEQSFKTPIFLSFLYGRVEAGGEGRKGEGKGGIRAFPSSRRGEADG